MGEMRNTDKISVRKYDSKKPLGNYRHRWEDKI
jgi:hypothetical protein